MIQRIRFANEFINFLRKDSNARKIFGKRELKIIEKQLNGEVLTQSERNRLSRDIRKKFDFIKEASAFSKDFKLKHGAIIKQKIAEIKESIIDSNYFKRIKRIYLFGSTAEHQRSYRSDIDIAVEFDSIDLKEATEFRIKFNYDERIDVQVYNVLPEKIKNEINKKGRVLYERE